MAIPTLTDIANRIVQGVGTLTGQIRNPFTEQIRTLEERLQATNNEDEIVKLNDQLRTLRAASEEWSGYDVAKQDPTAAPEGLQGIYGLAKTAGDNFDLVDVGTSFIPVGAVTKGARLAASGLKKAGKAAELGAKKIVDSAVARAGEKAAEAAVKNNPVGPKVQRTLREMRKSGVIDPSVKDKFNTRAFNEATRRIRKADNAIEKASGTKSTLEMRRMDAHGRYNRAVPSAQPRIRDEIRALTRKITKAGINENKAVEARKALSTEEAIVKNGEKYVDLLNARHAAREAARRETDQIAKGAYTRASKNATSEAANSSIARGLTAAGEGASSLGTGVERGAEWLASHPVISGAGEQALIEGAHGAASYNPEYSPSMGLNALEQGGLAGLMQGGISALGLGRLRALNNAKNAKNKRIEASLEKLRSGSSNVPSFAPERAGHKVLTPEEYELIKKDLLENVENKFKFLNEEGNPITLKNTQVNKNITKTADEMRKVLADRKYPSKEELSDAREFSRHFFSNRHGKTRGYVLPKSRWGNSVYGRSNAFPVAEWHGVVKNMEDVMKNVYFPDGAKANMLRAYNENPYEFLRKYNIPNYSYKGFETDVPNKVLSRKLLAEAGLDPKIADEIETAIGLPRELERLNKEYKNYTYLKEGAGLNPLARLYSAQTNPGNIRQRAAYNALLDAAREGGLAGLYGLGYLDGEEE